MAHAPVASDALHLSARRLRVGVAVALVLLLILGLRLVFVQGVDAAGHAQKAMDERLRSITLTPDRGSILDREGRVLASSVQRYDLVVDQRLVTEEYKRWNHETNSQQVVRLDDDVATLAPILSMDPDELKQRLMGERPYRVVLRGVTPEVKNRAMEVRVPGLLAEPVAERSYPNGAVAGNILGFISDDGQPLEGLEVSQDEQLAGTPGTRTYEIGRDGIRIPNAEFSETPAVDGNDIQLTIDQDVQWFAQEAIATKAAQYNAAWANIVVQDVKTGEILAMADNQTVDPSNPQGTDSLFWRPTSFTQSYEPGSTGKVATFATALEKGGVKPQDEYSVPNKQEFEGHIINDSLPHATYNMTTAGIFTRSYNTGTVQVANSVDTATRFEFMKKLGFGQPIDIGLPGGNQGILAPPEQWDGRQKYTTMFGQGYTVTSLHTAQMFQTVANGGVKMQPRLIDSYIDADGIEHRADSGEGTRVYSEQTSQEMLKLMEGVVQEGTGGDAKIPGYRVGGKTGTGQAAGAVGYDGHTTSFTAVAPLDDPRFVVSVAVHRPQGYWRDWKVTDTAGQVMGYLLNKYNVPPTDAEPQHYDVFTEEPQKRPW
ncbi:penicillin-binding protein 2 [Micrococcus terreus]|uniref:peptidoglycan D,D-transpeptidase FtsI family protein n=1 Tax=Micrococcus terreus TaxID=574650 RepID=UPI003018160E